MQTPQQPEEEEQQTLDLGDPKQVKARKGEMEDLENLRREMIKTMMDSKAGRAFFADLVFIKCHINSNSFDSDHAIHSFREGERNIGQQVQAELLSICPESFVTMLKEGDENA